jgi:hypothetical protein
MDTTTSALYGIVTLTFKFDLDLQATDLGLVCDTLSLCVWHFCQVIWKSLKKWQRYWADKTKSTVPGIMTLTSKYDLDHLAMDLGPVCHMSSSCVWHFCQVISRNGRVTEQTRPPLQYNVLWLWSLSVTLTLEQPVCCARHVVLMYLPFLQCYFKINARMTVIEQTRNIGQTEASTTICPPSGE